MNWRNWNEVSYVRAEPARVSRFARFVKRVSQIFYGKHGFENRYGTNYPTDAWEDWLKHQLSKVRVDLCFDESDGFDVGCFYSCNKAARGPFMLHRQSACSDSDHRTDCCLAPQCRGPWRLMIALSADAYRGFNDAAIK